MYTLPLEPRYIICVYVNNKKGKTDKYPINPNTLKTHDAHDPAIWMERETAEKLVSTLGSNYSLGFVFIPQDKYFFIDIDNCLLPSGQWSPIVSEVCGLFPSCYIEVSQSGRGIHIIGRYEGETPDHGCKNLALGMELYTSGRFCALTKSQAQGDSKTLNTPSLTSYITRYNFHKTATENKSDEWTTESSEGCNPPEDNSEIIRIIKDMPKGAAQVFQGKQHADFTDLFENNEEELAKYYPSQSDDSYDRSSADSALAYRLHYFLGGKL